MIDTMSVWKQENELWKDGSGFYRVNWWRNNGHKTHKCSLLVVKVSILELEHGFSKKWQWYMAFDLNLYILIVAVDNEIPLPFSAVAMLSDIFGQIWYNV